ncbi:hypothetical protein ACWC24_12445 [Streptomyces sp. NPDC001443]
MLDPTVFEGVLVAGGEAQYGAEGGDHVDFRDGVFTGPVTGKGDHHHHYYGVLRPAAAWPHRAASLPRPMSSAYRRQVERIAPPQLLGRDAELAELAGFCLEEQRGSYVWWQAGPWAGKSALLSTFVLNPPEALSAGRVRLVSFFITARLASQDTREAFTTVLTEQLCSLLGLDLPLGGDEAAREAALLDLLAQAAAACQQEGGRLALVVDGLDEDRGVTTGPGAHSIAGLLPGRPPAGMRVIVAGRPNPPIPDDVPDWHPLYDPGIIRLLGDSLHARNLQRLGQSELKRLLKGSPVEQNLLGLLTAARGGLSGTDLRELTGADLVTVEEVLHTVAGRTFTRRLATWSPDDAPQVYLLGHEELHNAACHYLGHDRLAHYRNRLHSWADSYRTPTDGQPPWPPHTPEYLLAGYSRMLATTNDTNRLAALAIDAARHDRMLDLSGGDAAALTEIKTCQDLLLASPEPDLYALARLSHRRSQLESRNANIPAELPAVWTTLGQPNRAEALAHALTNPLQQVRALVRVVEAVAATGDHERARAMATDAEQIARTITEPFQHPWALVDVAGAVAAAGDHQRAEQIARTITDPFEQGQALADVAGAVAATGDHQRAERIARTFTDPYWQVRALADVAGAVAATGDHERARAMATDAEQIARTIANKWVMVRVAGAVAAAGDHQRAEQIARTFTNPFEQGQALADVAGAVAATGNHQRAEQIARTITNPFEQGQALADVAGAVAATGDYERARAMATDAEQIVRTITDPSRQAQALADVAGAAAAAGDYERAEQIARTITNPHWQAQALADVAGAAAAAGNHQRAEQIARTITDPSRQAHALADVAGAAAAAGDYERARAMATDAEQIARTITDPSQQAELLTGLVEAVAAAGDHERARAMATDAEQIARTITDPDEQAFALADVAGAAAAAGDYERARAMATDAEQIVRTITDPSQQAELLTGLVEAVAAAGDHQRAEQIARTITEPLEQAQALTGLAGAVAAAGDHERARAMATDAEQIARTITDPSQQARALADVAGAVASAGDHERARKMVTDAEQIAHTNTNRFNQAWVLVGVACAMAAAGDYERAEQIARTITNPSEQAQALTGVAKAVGLPRADHLLGEAFALGSWLTPLPVLAKIHPQEVIRIADAVYVDSLRVMPD